MNSEVAKVGRGEGKLSTWPVDRLGTKSWFLCMQTPSERSRRAEAWAKRLPPGQFRPLFEHLASTLFFAKDSAGRIMCANTAFAQRCGFKISQARAREVLERHRGAVQAR